MTAFKRIFAFLKLNICFSMYCYIALEKRFLHEEIFTKALFKDNETTMNENKTVTMNYIIKS